MEQNADIAKVYSDFFPDDTVIIGDAHEYLLKHFSEYDFIWSSPPCPTHSKFRYLNDIKVYPDMKLKNVQIDYSIKSLVAKSL